MPAIATSTATAAPTRKPRAPRPRNAKTAATPSSPALAHVHETVESAALVELTPPHPPREDTPEYRQTHQLLVFEKDTPCYCCGVRHSDLQDATRRADPTINPVGASAIETHHYPCERSLIDAVDWRKVHARFPAVYSQASLIMWVDSPENMLCLCDKHHRDPEMGIHHSLTQDFAIRPYLLDGYIVAATAKDAATDEAKDEQIEQAAGIEQQVDAQMASPIGAAPVGAPAKPKRARKPRKATVAA